MLIVLVDRVSDYFTECFGVSSYGEIPLFHKKFFNFLKSNIYDILGENYVIFSENISKIYDNETVVSSSNELVDYMKKTECKRVAFFFVNCFFTLDSLSFNIALNSNDNLLISDKNNEIFGGVFNSNQAANLLKYSKDFSLNGFKNFENFHLFNCVENGEIINNIKDYKRLVNRILSGDLSAELPENAQGFYSFGKVPKGDYTIIPPVYFGSDIQIEPGTVIGPYSVIYDSSLVARNSTIKNSILLNNCFISKDCFLDDCICCSNVSVRRASSILSGAVIGSNYLLSEGSKIESDAYITEIVLNNDEALSELLSRRSDITRTETDEGIVEIYNKDFNIKYQKRYHNNPKIYLKASSFEIAEELMSDLK